MPTITLKNIPDELHQRLRLSANRHHRSLNREIISLLETSLAGGSNDTDELFSELNALHSRLPPVDHELIDKLKREGRA
ncbi:MAG: FitA-like ribbon-helix-helix domain-containing protein [Gammaproteobacteria bacterium]